MIKLFFDISEKETDIKGYWLDNKGKLYIDNIKIVGAVGYRAVYSIKQDLFKTKKQEAIFYKEGKRAFVEDKEGNIKNLRYCLTWEEDNLTEAYIKALVKVHGGLTVYTLKNGFKLEIWKE